MLLRRASGDRRTLAELLFVERVAFDHRLESDRQRGPPNASKQSIECVLGAPAAQLNAMKALVEIEQMPIDLPAARFPAVEVRRKELGRLDRSRIHKRAIEFEDDAWKLFNCRSNLLPGSRKRGAGRRREQIDVELVERRHGLSAMRRAPRSQGS